jgi:hypothetical protein
MCGFLSAGGGTTQGELMRKLLRQSRQQRSGIISALYAGERPICRPFVGIAAAISVSNCRNVNLPP